MPGDSKNGMHCGEFDALLAEALDQTLSGEKLAGFQAHARVCPSCGPLFAEVEAGHRWMKSLEAVEPPAHLVHNILAATTGKETHRAAAVGGKAVVEPSLRERVREWADVVFGPVAAMARQPRFAMSFGMAFFSLSIALSVAGVKLSDLRHLDLRPASLKRNYYETTGRVVKYYENIRFVYEIESRVRELKRATTPAEPAPEQNDRIRKNNNTSGQPDQKQERNYSRSENQLVLAAAPSHPPVVTVTTYRRLV
jgi:hypothetical protein